MLSAHVCDKWNSDNCGGNGCASGKHYHIVKREKKMSKLTAIRFGTHNCRTLKWFKPIQISTKSSINNLGSWKVAITQNDSVVNDICVGANLSVSAFGHFAENQCQAKER